VWRTFLIVTALIGAACRTQAPAGPKPGTVGWRPIGSWSGHGDAQTESFNIEGGEWRIKWVTTHETSPGAGTFRVTAHSAVSGRPIKLAIDHRGVGHGTAFVTEDPRLYHLVIESANLDWSIVVEEAVIAE
jgi:hypothetical protein